MCDKTLFRWFVLLIVSALMVSCGELFAPCLLGDYKTYTVTSYNDPVCPETNPPRAVNTLMAIGGNREVTLTWVNPSDPDLAELNLLWWSNRDNLDTGKHTFTSVSFSEAMTYTITGLQDATQYTFAIKTTDAFKNTKNDDLIFVNAITFSPIDRDGDKLIDIRDLDMLNNIRHNFTGTSYKTSAGDFGTRCTDRISVGVNCVGYELVADLDFAADESYASGSVNNDWRPNQTDPASATNRGWIPFGDNSNPFATIFEGNGHTIGNLYARGDGIVGLFGQIGKSGVPVRSGEVRNLFIRNGAVYGGNGDNDSIGVVAGILDRGIISSGSVSNSVADGEAGTTDRVGILVGINNSTISNSATVLSRADGGTGDTDRVGALVGENSSSGIIVASRSTSAAADRLGDSDAVGGLVGRNDGAIIASYATGTVDGGAGGSDTVGGLVGMNAAIVIASYATGAVDGGAGGTDIVGGLVGRNDGAIIASYATGTVDGGAGGSDAVGGLVGIVFPASVINASYAFGSVVGNEQASGTSDGTRKPHGVTRIDQLTAGNVGVVWNSSVDRTAGAWLFDAAYGGPAIKYADYDGRGGIDHCAQFPTGACGANRPLPNQLSR